MHTKINAVTERMRKKVQDVNIGRALYTAFLIPTAAAATPLQAHAAGDTIWTKASEIMQDVYTQILGISTIAAIVTASIALLLMNFSRSGRTVDESRAWLKRIIITWALLWRTFRPSSPAAPGPPQLPEAEKGLTDEEKYALLDWRRHHRGLPVSCCRQHDPYRSSKRQGSLGMMAARRCSHGHP